MSLILPPREKGSKCKGRKLNFKQIALASESDEFFFKRIDKIGAVC